MADNLNNENPIQEEEQFVSNLLAFLSNGSDSLEKEDYNQFIPSVGGGFGGLMGAGDFSQFFDFVPFNGGGPNPTPTDDGGPTTDDNGPTPTNTTNTPTTSDPATGPSTGPNPPAPGTPGPTRAKP